MISCGRLNRLSVINVAVSINSDLSIIHPQKQIGRHKKEGLSLFGYNFLLTVYHV